MAETGFDRRENAEKVPALRLVPGAHGMVGDRVVPRIRLRRELKESIVELPGEAAPDSTEMPPGAGVIDGRDRDSVVQGPWAPRRRRSDLIWYALLGLGATLASFGGSW